MKKMVREALPIMRLRALSVSRPVFDLLQQSRTGSVLATFARSCYLDLAGQIIAIVLPDLLNGPLNLIAAADSRFAFHRLQVGARVSSSPTLIRFDDAAEVSLEHALVWNPVLARWDHRALSRVGANLTLVGSLLQRDAPEGSLAAYLHEPMNVPARAAKGMRMLEHGLAHPARLAEATEQLAGLGHGLTPSGDDVLVGAMVCLSILPDDGSRGLREIISGATRGRTTRISEAYLTAAARGEAGEAWHQLRSALLGDDREEVASASRRVMAFGETSGADMLAGFLLALSAQLRRR